MFTLSRSRLTLLVVVASFLLAMNAQPASATVDTNCSGSVCEEVVYSGSTATSWKATVFPGGGWHCETARFFINGGLYNSKTVCGNGLLTAYANTPLGIGSGWSMCASWVGFSGYACVTV